MTRRLLLHVLLIVCITLLACTLAFRTHERLEAMHRAPTLQDRHLDLNTN